MKLKFVPNTLEIANLKRAIMKQPASKAVLLLIAANYALFTMLQLPADSASAPASSQSKEQNGSLRWVSEQGTAYLLQAVPPPPTLSSDKEKADLAAVLQAQAARTAAEMEEAKADQTFAIELMAKVIGPDFTAKNYPVTFDLLNRLQTEMQALSSMLQAKYQRHRPYQDHPEVKNLYTVDQPGYPGLQAAESRMTTLILSQLFAENTTSLLDRDQTIAQSSVDAGANYPSDIIGGRALAHSLLFVLQSNPIFMSDLAKAKAEVIKKSGQSKKE